jgi:NAD(P)-dependent dehydrogenase (short-subunit alcohol dehydrogenase family)
VSQQRRTVLVTGAASGIGRAAAEALAEDGWFVVAADQDERVVTIADRLGGRGTVVDVANTGEIDSWVANAPLADALVTAAGRFGARSLVDSADREWEDLLAVNLLGSMKALRAWARTRIAAGGGGAAVLIASNNAFWPGRGLSAYCASKAGVLLLGRCAASELGEYDIRVNVLAPGVTDTPMIAQNLARQPSLTGHIVDRTPLGRLGSARDVALAVRVLLSDDASWITGQLLSADGGVTLRGEPDVEPESEPYTISD